MVHRSSLDRHFIKEPQSIFHPGSEIPLYGVEEGKLRGQELPGQIGFCAKQMRRCPSEEWGETGAYQL